MLLSHPLFIWPHICIILYTARDPLHALITPPPPLPPPPLPPRPRPAVSRGLSVRWPPWPAARALGLCNSICISPWSRCSSLYIHTHVYIHLYIYVCVCMYIDVCVYILAHIHIHTHIHTHILIHICIYIHAYIHTYIHTYRSSSRLSRPQGQGQISRSLR